MRIHFLTPILLAVTAAGVIAAAPIAAAAILVTGNTGGGVVTTDERPVHVATQVKPPTVSEPRSYGQSSSPEAFYGE
jgi:ABC-type nitrate/sulfonate/bicarbonate transport system substrate-binding protein